MPSLSAIIRDSGLTLSEIHRRSGVGRTTLSRITNGRQAISRQTADKLAPVLGFSAEELMRSPSTQPAAPEVLRISALRLKQWGETRRAEEELPGLVSRLIRSELFAAGCIRAPSDERIIEPGPDIAVNNPARATRHIPGGRSVWEVSTRADVKEKATEDLSRRGLPTGWQQETTSFAFVTTRSWPGAKEWAFQQHSKHPWRSITVLDATDLQGWIEESLGVQLWLMDRMGLEREGFQWLRAAVQDWSSVADPPPGTALLRSSVDRHFTAWREWLRSPPRNPLTIIGESRGETLLFVQALIEHGASQAPRTPVEGLCVSTEEALRHLVGSPPSDVVVIPTNERVRELAVAHSSVLRVVLPATGQPRVMNPLNVSPAGITSVRDFLVGEGVDSGRAAQLARSSGGSVSVLRRLTRKDGAGTPDFQLPNRLSPILAAAGLFGIWDAGSVADRKIVLRLTGQRCDEDLEKAWTDLLDLPESPVWMDGERRGVNSRLDTWQRFTEGKVTPQAVDRYFAAVGTALGEAPLDRPGERLLLPDDYQALRDSQVSGELLRGLAQGLVLLAAFGERMNQRLVGPPVSARVAQAVFTALDDMTVDRLRILHAVMPLLAEAAPEAFLEAMEADLQQTNSAQKALLNFRRGDSGSESARLIYSTDVLSYRSSLMRAYETLAWFPEYAEQAIDLLAQLADEEILDHHGGQPRQSLAELLKPWHCGSVLDAERHCAVLRKLAEDRPEWAFDFVQKCLRPGHDTASPTNLPLWRGEPDGAESIRSEQHNMEVYRTAADILVQYAGKSEKTVIAAIGSVDNLPEKQAARVWKSVATWATSESCSPEERTRLVRHLTAFADGALIRHRREDNRAGARRVLEELSGFPVTAPDLWLFGDNATIREHRPDDSGWEATAERLEQKRRSALQALRESGGIEAILSLVPEIRNTSMLGAVASRVLSTDEVHSAVRKAFHAGGGDARSPMRWFIQGLLNEIDDVDADALTDVILSSSFAKRNPDWLPCLLARLPLGLGAPRADGLSGKELKLYWEQFDSERHVIPPERKDWLIAGLCSVVRPRAALWALRGNFEGARTDSLRLLIDTLPQSEEQNLDDLDNELVTAIRKRPDLSPDDAAGIEFMFFDVLEADEMPALAKAVASNPSWFRESLMLCMGREDHAEDPPEWTERRERAPEWLRHRAYRLFKWLPRLPGTTSSGYDVKQGLAWTTAILSFAEKHDRREVAESLLGQAFGSAGFHQDGTPADELTKLLEVVRCSRIEQAVAITVGNQLGAVWLPTDDAGRPYRTRAALYRELETRYRDSAPRTARVMRLLHRRFASQGQWADDHRRLDDRRDAQG